MRVVLGVFALLGVLVAVGILAVLGGRALDGVGDDDASVFPEGATSPEGVALDQPDAPPDAPAGPIGAARAGLAACDADRATLELAASAFELTQGRIPLDQAELVGAGLLEQEVATHRMDVAGGEVVVSGVGSCAPG